MVCKQRGTRGSWGPSWGLITVLPRSSVAVAIYHRNSRRGVFLTVRQRVCVVGGRRMCKNRKRRTLRATKKGQPLFFCVNIRKLAFVGTKRDV